MDLGSSRVRAVILRKTIRRPPAWKAPLSPPSLLVPEEMEAKEKKEKQTSKEMRKGDKPFSELPPPLGIGLAMEGDIT